MLIIDYNSNNNSLADYNVGEKSMRKSKILGGSGLVILGVALICGAFALVICPPAGASMIAVGLGAASMGVVGGGAATGGSLPHYSYE